MSFLKQLKLLKNSQQFEIIKSSDYFYFISKFGVYRASTANILWSYRPHTGQFNLYLKKLELGLRGICDGYFSELYLYGIGYRA